MKKLMDIGIQGIIVADCHLMRTSEPSRRENGVKDIGLGWIHSTVCFNSMLTADRKVYKFHEKLFLG